MMTTRKFLSPKGLRHDLSLLIGKPAITGRYGIFSSIGKFCTVFLDILSYTVKKRNGGALLFAIITAFVLSLVGSTFVVFTTNQYKIVDSEVDRTVAYNLAQAGFEYAIYNLYSETATWIPGTVGYTPDHSMNETINGTTKTATIHVVNDASGKSKFEIKVDVSY